jgi:DNA polymerase-3 subunit gamma/tau
MSYVVLARKWRPQSFEDLVGQEHVSRTLANAIAGDRVAHAFLFTGVRGVGKTTSARILAKALNCEKGPTATPCQQCAPCQEIGDSADVDVQEIDGASYNGVDEVRRLQESLPYRPARDRFKIYIVDEVHMLSQAAWNAFLKTLEEPPPHVKFIFATTEVHKVPVTILSRCQRYDFKLIRTSEIAARLRHVLEAENMKADDEAVRIIAREAAGSMRDAMSLLDQVIAWVGHEGSLDAEGVARVLGVAARSVHHRLGQALIEGDAAACLRMIDDLAQQGFAFNTVARDFLAHLRDLVVAKVSDKPERLLDLADDELADVRALAETTSADDLTRLQLGFSRAYDDVARSAQPRTAFEMALVRLARRPKLVPIDELLERLASLEQRVAAGGGGGGGPAGTGGPADASGSGGHGPRGGGGRPRGARGASAQASAAAPQAEPRPVKPPPPAARPVAAPSPAAPSPAAPLPAAPSPAAPSPAAPSPAAPSPAAPSRAAPANAAAKRPPNGAAKPSPDDAPRAQASPLPGDVTLGEPSAEALARWRTLLKHLAERQPAIASYYEHAAPLAIAPGQLVLGYPGDSFLAQQAQDAKALGLLVEVAAEVMGEPTAVSFDLQGRHRVKSVATRNSEQLAARKEAARKKVAEHPFVAQAIDVLGAELREVRLPSE